MATDEFPVQITKRSAAWFQELRRANYDPTETIYVRVFIDNGRRRVQLIDQIDTTTDIVGHSFGFQVAVPKQDIPDLTGIVVDYRSVGPEGGVVFRDPKSVQSIASEPGRIALSKRKLRVLHPELFARENRFFSWLPWYRPDPGLEEFCETLAEHLARGDSRAAAVVSTDPLVIASYTDDLDCVALLRFPGELLTTHHLQLGSRLLTVNLYQRATPGEELPGDLAPGPENNGQFINFAPVIADFLAEDMDRVIHRKQQITEKEWQRVMKLGMKRLQSGAIPRDGRPLYCSLPASVE